jgi:hypothetical protein
MDSDLIATALKPHMATVSASAATPAASLRRRACIADSETRATIPFKPRAWPCSTPTAPVCRRGMARPSATTPRTTLLAAGGGLLTLAGVVGYFVVGLHLAAALPWLRNHAVVSWVPVVLGGALAARAVARAPRGRRLVPSLLLAIDALLTVKFALFLYVVTAVPPATGPALGRPAPSFALPDQTGRTVRLEDFHGHPLLLVFYRGHW